MSGLHSPRVAGARAKLRHGGSGNAPGGQPASLARARQEGAPLPAGTESQPNLPRQRRPWSLLVLLSTAQFMVILDATVVNVALPSIAKSLSFSPSALQWVVTAYVLVSGGFVLLGGRATDVIGRRRIFLAGLVLFTIASLASGLAPTAGALIASRAAQGAGAAMLTPGALSIITTAYAGAQRAAALGIWGALAGSGAAVGVLAGGVLTSWLGWRAVFLVNVPVGLIAGLLSLRMVPSAPPTGKVRRELDLPGAALAVAGIVTIAYSLSGAPAHGWASARTLLMLFLGLLLLAGFAFAERHAQRKGRRPLVTPQIWRNRPLVAGVLVMFASTGLLVATFFLNTLYLQYVLGASPLRVGLEFLPLALVIGLGAHLASRLLPHAGSRVLIVAGLASMGAGALLLTQITPSSSYWTGMLPGLLIVGIGTGLTLPSASIAAMSNVTEDSAGLASGLMSTAHEIGGALGVAVFSAVAVAVSGGIAAGYSHGFAVAAAISAGLAVVAAVMVPAVRPAAGARVAVH
ncbi:MAG TPA: MFS transporter [Streptosporangiaceae bacterium]|nr:MFS transporter [Streptosporangiaceae bacterium]